MVADLVERLEPYVRATLDSSQFLIDTSSTSRLKQSDALKEVRLRFATEVLASSWSEALRWAYKETQDNVVKLRDCLLPYVLGRTEKAWYGNIDRSPLNREQAEEILRKFGQEELSSGIELPWGGYVYKAEHGYELSLARQE